MSNASQAPACYLTLRPGESPASPPVWTPPKPTWFAKPKLVQEAGFSTTFSHWFWSLMEFGAKLRMQNYFSNSAALPVVVDQWTFDLLAYWQPPCSWARSFDMLSPSIFTGCFWLDLWRFSRISSGFPLAVPIGWWLFAVLGHLQ